MRTVARRLSWKRTTARPLHLSSTRQRRTRTCQREWMSRWAWSTWSTSKRLTTPITSSSNSDYSGSTTGGSLVNNASFVYISSYLHISTCTGWNITIWRGKGHWMLSHWKSSPLSGFHRLSLRTLRTTRPWKEQKTARFARVNGPTRWSLAMCEATLIFISFWLHRSLLQGREISSEAVLRRQMRFRGCSCFSFLFFLCFSAKSSRWTFLMGRPTGSPLSKSIPRNSSVNTSWIFIPLTHRLYCDESFSASF